MGRSSRRSRDPTALPCAVLSCVQLFVTLRTIACRAPLSTEFSRQEYWSGLPFPTPGDLPDPGIKHNSCNSCTGKQILYPLSHLGIPLRWVRICQSLSHVWLFVTPWTVVLQAHLSMEFSRQEYWGGLPFPTPGKLSDPGIEHESPVSSTSAGRFSTTLPPGKPH